MRGYCWNWGRITGDAKDSPLTRVVQSGYGWTAWLPGGKHANQREHRTEVTEATEGETGFGELPHSVTPELLQLLAPVKSIAQRPQRSQRGIWGILWWTGRLVGGKRRNQREHRTEATEGETGFGELPHSVTPELLQLLAPVKSIAQRSQRPQRGILVGSVAWAGNTRIRESPLSISNPGGPGVFQRAHIRVSRDSYNQRSAEVYNSRFCGRMTAATGKSAEESPLPSLWPL